MLNALDYKAVLVSSGKNPQGPRASCCNLSLPFFLSVCIRVSCTKRKKWIYIYMFRFPHHIYYTLLHLTYPNIAKLLKYVTRPSLYAWHLSPSSNRKSDGLKFCLFVFFTEGLASNGIVFVTRFSVTFLLLPHFGYFFLSLSPYI